MHRDIGSHKFWSTQPVNKDPQQSVEAEGPIEQDKTPDQIRQEPLPLSAGFEWCTVDLNNEEQVGHDSLSCFQSANT